MVWAAWRTPLRWPAVLLNAAMLASAPVFGSHYLVDLLAGGAIGALAIWMIKGVVALADDTRLFAAYQPEEASQHAPSRDAFPSNAPVT